jgi:hypothetical protein
VNQRKRWFWRPADAGRWTLDAGRWTPDADELRVMIDD